MGGDPGLAAQTAESKRATLSSFQGLWVGTGVSFSQRQWGQCSGSYAHTDPWIRSVGCSVVILASLGSNPDSQLLSHPVGYSAGFRQILFLLRSANQPLLLTTKTPKRISFYSKVFPYVLTRQASSRVPTQIDRRRLTKGASWTSRPSL